MKNLQEATERICELKGSLLALDALIGALLEQLPAASRAQLLQAFRLHSEVARTVLLHAPISEFTLNSFDHDVARMGGFIAATT